ncbi:hypothetical protein ADMFC3_12620 [Geovibrio sp. ADMFC3]
MILETLAGLGLTKLYNVVKDKGLDVVKDKLGIDIGALLEKGEAGAAELRRIEAEKSKQLDALMFGDKADAREMQRTALMQTDLFSKRFVYYLALAWSLFAFVLIPALIFCPIPPENIRLADTVVGFLLGTIVAAIIQFFFGSSNDSDKKTEIFMNLREK